MPAFHHILTAVVRDHGTAEAAEMQNAVAYASHISTTIDRTTVIKLVRGWGGGPGPTLLCAAYI